MIEQLESLRDAIQDVIYFAKQEPFSREARTAYSSLVVAITEARQAQPEIVTFDRAAEIDRAAKNAQAAAMRPDGNPARDSNIEALLGQQEYLLHVQRWGVAENPGDDSEPAVVTLDDLPAEYREGGKPSGEPLVQPYLSDATEWQLLPAYIARNYGPGAALTKRIKVGRKYAYSYSQLAALRRNKTEQI